MSVRRLLQWTQRHLLSGVLGGVCQLLLLGILLPVLCFVATIMWAFHSCVRRRALRAPPKTVLITGASSGIGAALAQHYAATVPGVFLALSGRSQERLQEIADQCVANGATVNTRVVDVIDREAMADWIVDVDRSHPLDLVVANAGVAAAVLREDCSEEDQNREIVDTNIIGTMNTVYPALAPMALRGSGQVALLGSVLGHVSVESSSYGATKAFVSSFADALRHRYDRHNIRISCIEPGAVQSRITNAVATKSKSGSRLPLEYTAEEAAVIIAEGLQREDAVIHFPFLIHTLCYLLGALPGNVRMVIWQILYFFKKRGRKEGKSE